MFTVSPHYQHNGATDGRRDGWMHACTHRADGRTDRDERTDKRTDRRDGLTDRWTDGWTDGRDGWTDGRTDGAKADNTVWRALPATKNRAAQMHPCFEIFYCFGLCMFFASACDSVMPVAITDLMLMQFVLP